MRFALKVIIWTVLPASFLALVAAASMGAVKSTRRSITSRGGRGVVENPWKAPRILPDVPVPLDNQMSEAKVHLGKQLFFEKRLSIDHSISCASCHDPEKGFTNGEAFGAGARGRKGRRNVPTLINVAFQPTYFWDGRRKSLEEQALDPILDKDEMALPSVEELEQRLNGIEGYRQQFKSVFGASRIVARDVAKALAAFERTLLSGEAPYDRYLMGERNALSPAAIRGLKLFSGQFRCTRCHGGTNLTISEFINIGLALPDDGPRDLGRFEVSNEAAEKGRFKTPTLREISRTAPYMHDGRMKSLEEVIDHYANRGGENHNGAIDDRIRGFVISGTDREDLLTFLKEGLQGAVYPIVHPPDLPD